MRRRGMQRRRRFSSAAVAVLGAALILTACGGEDTVEDAVPITEPIGKDTKTPDAPVFEKTEEVVNDPRQESGADGEIDFAAQYEIRPDIVGWIYVPGTDIDCPVYAKDTGEGAYLTDGSTAEMMDFSCVLTAPAAAEGDPFATLYNFADPSFFEGNGKIVYYQPYGTMIYAVMAAYEADAGSLYISLADGSEEEKQAFLDDMRAPGIGKNSQGELLAGLTTQNFFLTLSAKTAETSEKQFIVTGMLASVE